MQSFEPGENWGWCYIDQVELSFPEPVVDRLFAE
jgi:hypothetical protein